MEAYPLHQIVSPLLSWYEEHRRILPWREDPTPYHVWLSEIMLQQTRVEAVIPYYERFLKALPDVEALAEAKEEVFLKLWEGLGYYSRVRNLHKAAITIMEAYGGTVPKEPRELLKLSGIGTYTAGAVASIAYGIREPAVDGNVLRILSRLTEDSSDILDPKTKESAEKKLREMMEGEDERFVPGAFNQALMDLGATICIPNGEPHCELCPLAPLCKAKKKGVQNQLPVRIKKTKRKIEQRTVLVLCFGDQLAIRKRPEKGLLAGLYELPSYLGLLSEDELKEAVGNLGYLPVSITPLGKAKHIFTHITWEMEGYLVTLATKEKLLPVKDNQLLFCTREELSSLYTLSSAFHPFLS